MSTRIFFLLLLNFAVLSVSANRPPRAVIQVNADRTTGFTGETYTLNFEVAGKGIESISWELIDNLFPEDILLKKSIPKVSGMPDDKFKRQIIFTSADTGQISIGPFPVIVRYLHETDTISAQEVNYYFKQRPQIKLINEIMPVSVGTTSVLHSGLFKSFGAVIFLGICIVMIALICRRTAPYNSIQLARDRALKGLDLIADKQAGNDGSIRDLQEEAARIFKGYLDYAYSPKVSFRHFPETIENSVVLSPEEEWLKRLMKNSDEARFGIKEQDDLSLREQVRELKEFIVLYPKADIQLKNEK
jgi:hypothetical protein